MARLTSVDAQTTLYLQGLSTIERRKFIKASASELFGDVRKNNRQVLGYDADEELSTDNVIDKPPEDMAFGGHSTTEFEIDEDIVLFTLSLLKRVSPFKASNRKSADEHYRESHIAMVDGAVLGPPWELPADWERLIFVNMQPYSRKIEQGLSSQRPNGVYEALVLPEVKRRYGSLYFIRFTYEKNLVLPFGKKSVRGTRLHKDGRRTPRRRTVTETARTALPAIIVEAK